LVQPKQKSDTVFSNAVSHGETNMRDNYSDDQASKPDCGSSEERHKHKDNRSATGNSGVVNEHHEKSDGKNRTEPISKPGPSGGSVRPEKQDETLSKPQGGKGPVPREHLHSGKNDDERGTKPKGDTDTGGQKFKITKRD
jgi:hypothetical protein